MEPDLADLARDVLFALTHPQRPAYLEPILREIGLEIHDHLTAIPVRSRYASDQQELVHAVSPAKAGHSPQGALAFVAELERGFQSLEFCRRADQRAHCLRRAALPSNDTAEITWRHEQFDQRLPAMLTLDDANGVGMIRQRPCHYFDDVSGAAHDAGCSATAAGAGGMRATSVRIESEGCAPAFTQCAYLSRFNSSVSGFVRGL
jgi:hypothetical protein